MHLALNKINSYMEFMKLVDPSENYHLLKFLRTLISDEPMELFELKAGLEQSRKLVSHKYSTKLIYKMLESSTVYLGEDNVWNQGGKDQIIQKYLQNQKIDSSKGERQIAQQLLKQVEADIAEHKLPTIASSEMRIKLKCKLLNRVCIAAALPAKSCLFNQGDLAEFKKICDQLEEDASIEDEELLKLQMSAKEAIMLA